jgi:hypothetical protein
MPFPINVWGDVTSAPTNEPGLRGIRVERHKEGSFSVLTRGTMGNFDMWLASVKHVDEYLQTMSVVWPEMLSSRP